MKRLWTNLAILILLVCLSPGLTWAAPKGNAAAQLEEPRWELTEHESFAALSALAPEASMRWSDPVQQTWGPEVFDSERLRNDEDFRWVSDDGWRRHDDDRGHICTVPEPSSWVLLTLGAALAAAVKVGRLRRIRLRRV